MKAPEENRRTGGEDVEARTGRFVYGFSDDVGSADVLALCGGKGSGLMRMRGLGLPVPEGFVITTEACGFYIKTREMPEGLMQEVKENLRRVEEATGREFGDPENPLLVSVRSGAPVSMPGMMDTVLNLGLNDETVRGLAWSTRDERFARDSHRRFIQAFGEIVLKVPGRLFEDAIEKMKEERGVEADTDLTANDLEELVDRFKEIVSREAGVEVPEDPHEQLELAIGAVFDSWLGERAVAYRREYGIPDSLGTAVTVQRMVFGNMGETSATGVAFTRNPATGEQGLFGEFLLNAQGEDVVAGIRTPRPLSEMERVLPNAYRQFLEAAERLEREYGDMQDMEFTIERDRLYMLQTRSGKRTGAAALKIARDMAEEGLISRAEAVLRVEPASLDQLLHPRIDPEVELHVLARGLPASPGAATGKIVLTAGEAKERAGEAVILVRRETNPDDVEGMISARGVLTALGGMTSHAAVVARGMGKPAVTGCNALKIDPTRGVLYVGDETFEAGDVLTIDGSDGSVIRGEAPLVAPEPSDDFETVLRWADEARALGVRANADTPEDARRARELGAEGVGLCRTEHMFMQGERLKIMREMILSEGDEALEEALTKLEPMQHEDFEGLFRAMDGLPVTVRLLDPPLHEFLPDAKDLAKEIAEREGRGENAGEQRRQLRVAESLEERNPMLGLRGCRLGLLKPEVYLMQARAIASAARVVREDGGDPRVEIMIPLVAFASELRKMREMIEAELAGEEVEISVGTMIELPRACAVADKIAAEADFFSFGTNDLTQMVCGISRDDAEEKFLAEYLNGGILSFNPFQTIDRDGVGQVVRMAIDSGREANPHLKLGVCGEHGGDPQSVAFFHETGLDYVSCSPFRVPGARLAAAQAALKG